MIRRNVLFEDRGWAALSPLTDLLPVPALAFGASNLATRWRRWLGVEPLAIEARPRAMAAWREAPQQGGAAPAPGEEVLAINAAALPGEWLDRALQGPGSALWKASGRIVGARLGFERLAPGLGRGEQFEDFLARLGLPEVAVEARLLAWPWNFVDWNEAALLEDLAALEPAVLGDVHPLAVVYEPGRVRVGSGARVDALAVLDARGGPIVLGEGVTVKPHTVVVGPCAVGPGTELLGGSVGRSTIGPDCRIAGEVESCLWQGRANKRHHGFIGHSVIGEWVNLGALTTTSDLKNNYGPVRVWVEGREVDSGTPKIGSFLGAHVKTGIGSLLPTGASVGTGSNLFGGGRFTPKRVPAFVWWDGERTVEHRLERFLETAGVAMGRRGLRLRPADEAALRSLHEATRPERAPFEAAADGPAGLP